MCSSKKYYGEIGLIRVISCIAVFLYHINILKGGYLAVCIFFVLSGYLSCVSCFKKDVFSLKQYYLNKLFHIYFPLIIVVFMSIAIISLFSNINWFNLKPETTSVLFGYNNFWQLSANLDYFARHVNSPFMHFWYIAIILQFDLIFPFMYILLHKLGDKLNKAIPCLISALIAIISLLLFYRMSIYENIMITYYNTFSRIFSLFFGVLIGFVHSYYRPFVPSFFNRKYISKLIFYTYLIFVIVSFIFIDSSSSYFSIFMILITLASCRLIDYGVISSKNSLSMFDRFIKSVSSISYEIYLLQYPIIFLFQYINISEPLKFFLVIILTVIISYLLHYVFNFKNKKSVLKIIFGVLMIFISSFGIYKYLSSKDYTNEMKQLEYKLAENVKIMEEMQKEYADSLKKEEENWMSILKEMENDENELSDVVKNLSVVGIGDSVMLGAIDSLYECFPNGYFDAKTSRTAWVANGILQDLLKKGLLADNIVINLGANGDCPDSCKSEIMNTISNRKVFWVNTNIDKNVNANLEEFSLKYDNLYVVDWNSISLGHPEYFVADGIHLTTTGKEVFTKTIYDSIYNVYLNEYKEKKAEILNAREDAQNNKISFFGNDILLNAYNYLKTDFNNAQFVLNSEYNFNLLKQEINNRINDKTLTKKLVFAFDKRIDLGKKEYEELIKLCNNYKIYILDIDGSLSNMSYENVKIINFYQQIILNNDYLMYDKTHFTDKGNKALNDVLKENIV